MIKLEHRLKQLAYAVIEKVGLGEAYRKYVFNLSWLFVDRIFRIAVGATIGIWIINYLGPQRYGMLNYALLFLSIGMPITSLGLHVVLVRDLKLYPNLQYKIINSAMLLRLCMSVLWLLVAFTLTALAGDDNFLIGLCMILTSSLFFQVIYAYDGVFQASVQSKYFVIAGFFGFILSTLLKVAAVVASLGILTIALAFVLEYAVSALHLYFIVKRRGMLNLKAGVDIRVTRRLLSTGLELLLISVLSSIYMRSDIYMIQQILGSEASGEYSAAVKFSEMMYFVPVLLINTFYPALVSAKDQASKYLRSINKLYFLLTWISLGLMVILYIASFLLNFVISSDYTLVAPTFRIHVISLLFVSYSIAASRQYTLFKKVKLFSLYTGFGALTNLILNAVLLPKMGIAGAAWATVISYGFNALFLFIFDPLGRSIIKSTFYSFNLLAHVKGFLAKRSNLTSTE